MKFSDVVGFGKIRFEFEEIVKFFIYVEMYCRRGVKMLGLIFVNLILFFIVMIIKLFVG